MKYVALVYYQESAVNDMTEQAWHDLNQECLGCVEKLTEGDHFLAGQALEPVASATTLKVREGEVMLSDGPFAETKEARDLNEALQLASHIPPARLGSIEVRPVRELPPKDE